MPERILVGEIENLRKRSTALDILIAEQQKGKRSLTDLAKQAEVKSENDKLVDALLARADAGSTSYGTLVEATTGKSVKWQDPVAVEVGDGDAGKRSPKEEAVLLIVKAIALVVGQGLAVVLGMLAIMVVVEVKPLRALAGASLVYLAFQSEAWSMWWYLSNA